MAGELDLTPAQRLQVLALQPPQGGPQAVHARQVQGPRLKAVGQELRHLRRIRGAAGAAGHQGVQRPGQGVGDDQPADALGPQQPLVPRKGQGVDVHLLHMDGHASRRLGGIHTQEDAPLPAQRPHLRHRQQGTADVGGVGEHHQSGVRRQTPLRRGQVQLAGRPAGQAVHRHPPGLQLTQGAQYGVVLQARDRHPVAGPQQPLKHEIEGVGAPRRQDDVLGRRTAQQGAQTLPHLQHGFRRVAGRGVGPPAHIPSHLGQIFRHGLGHALRLGKRGGGLVKLIGPFHGRPSCL